MPAVISQSDLIPYQPHELHTGPRAWPESNCYVDLWIEILHALALDPHAMLAHVLDVDFEGDQWTFVKPCSEDLRFLYGIEVQELQVWDRFARHVIDQLGRGRLLLAEVDAFYLPDTAGVSHHHAHVKTTIAIERIDLEAARLGYFHNAGFYLVDGPDFASLIAPEQLLPAYVELVKVDRRARLPDAELRRRSWQLCSRNLTRRTRENPILRYAAEFDEHARWLSRGDLEFFHVYAFASLRQCGAACELAARYLRWLAPDDSLLGASADDFEAIALAAKATLFRVARAVQAQKPADLRALTEVAARWDSAFERLSQRLLESYGEVA